MTVRDRTQPSPTAPAGSAGSAAAGAGARPTEDLTDPRPQDTVGEARSVSAAFLAGAQVEATVDGEPVRVTRKKGPVATVDGRALGIEGPVRTTVDGYWLVWEAEPGTHAVSTYGIVRTGQEDEFMSATSYTFHVS